VIVYPAHGPGSSCGKNLGPNTHSTIGEERKTNYALQPQTKEAFVKAVLTGLDEAPKYFAINAAINQQGYESMNDLMQTGLQHIPLADFKDLMAQDEYIVLDTRHATVFTHGFVPGSIFIGLENRYAEWAALLLPFDKNILLVTEAGKEEESVVRLSRVGFAKMSGVLQGGFEAWKVAGEKVDLIVDVEADEMAMDIPFDPQMVIVDVRRETEYADGHIKDSLNIPLVEFTDVGMMADFEDNQNLYVHCAGGYRSVIAASLLKRQGIHNLRNVLGGWGQIKLQENIEVEKEKSVLN
jgi:hydroxyacylglutathione hydrolase